MEVTHLCTVKRRHSGTYLPPLPEEPTWGQKFKRKFRTSTLVSSKHPKCIEYFKSATGLRRERKRHVQSRYRSIIHPFSMFRIYYEIYMCVVYFVVILVHTFDLDFEFEVDSIDIIKAFAATLCLGDIVINFVTGYAVESNREIILEPGKIAKRYIRSFFFIDLIAFTPLDMILCLPFFEGHEVGSKVISVFQMVKIFRLYTMNTYAMKTAEYFGMQTKKIFKICQHLTTIYIIVNVLGFLHFNIPQFHDIRRGIVAQKSWIRQDKLLSRQENRYPYTFFRTTALVLNASKGISDSLEWEEILLTIMTFIFGKFYVILLTVLALHMMMSSRTLQIKYEQIMNQLDEYMAYKDLPIEMRKRLRLYYDYKYQKKFFRESVISSILSDGLKREIKMHVCRKMVANVSLFSDMPANVVSDILEYLKSEVYLPMDCIIKAGETGECMYFLSSGTVAVYTPSGREICHLQDGTYFGEISLVMKDQFRTATVIAVEICEVYSLARKYFKKYFMNNKNLYQKMYQIAEDRFEMLVLVEELTKKKTYKSK